MIDFGRIAYEVFKILETYDYNVIMFDASGNGVIEPKLARRFFSKGKDVAVDIIEDAENSVLKFIKSESIPMTEVLGFSQSLMKLANETYMMTFVIEGHDGPIIPKNFATPLGEGRKDSMDLTENMYGTSRSSYLKLGNSRLIVKHSGKVDEAVAGARSRRIDRMFVENAQGERFLLETRYLSAGKAIAQHISHGGSVSDEKGEKLCEMARDYKNLSVALRHIRKNADALEEGACALREGTAKARGDLRKTFERVYRNYENVIEGLASDEMLFEDEALMEAKARISACLACEGAELDDAVIESVARFNFEKPEAIEEAKQEDLVDVMGTNVCREAFLAFAEDHVLEFKSTPDSGGNIADNADLSRAISSIAHSAKNDSMANLLSSVSSNLLEDKPKKLAIQIANRALKIAKEQATNGQLQNTVMQEHFNWIESFTIDNIFLNESEDDCATDDCEDDKEVEEDVELSREDVILPKNSSPDLKREVVKKSGKEDAGPQMLLDDEDESLDCKATAESRGFSVGPASALFKEDADELEGKVGLILPNGDFLATVFESEDDAWRFGATYSGGRS